jgi:hypothetical protein
MKRRKLSIYLFIILSIEIYFRRKMKEFGLCNIKVINMYNFIKEIN